MKKIIYTRPDGGLSVVTPARNTLGETLTTDEEIEQRAWDALPADAINPQFVDPAVIPTDRTYRDAWRHDAGNTVTHDMAKCRAIHRENLRLLRKPKFEKLDAEFMKALEINDTASMAVISAKRQALRDAPQYQGIDVAQTPDDLKAMIPSALE